jgi:hypothetical protein
MISPHVRGGLAVFTLAVFGAGSGWAAETAATPKANTGKIAPAASSARPAPSTSKSGARGPLPDPALLDGSAHPAEKKSEHGMIGDFELPGDENVRSGKVGGPQNPNAQGGGQGAPQISVNIPNPLGLPNPLGGQQGGGGAQGQQSPMGMPAGAQGGAQGGQQSVGAIPPGGMQQGGAQAGGANPGGNPIPGGGDPGAQAQGIQVAELGGDAASGQAGAGAGPGDRPQQVSIGDSAMRIDPAAGGAQAAGVVGGQQQVAGHTQQHEKGTGSGGKGSGGAQSGNRVEKGRVIPAGL